MSTSTSAPGTAVSPSATGVTDRAGRPLTLWRSVLRRPLAMAALAYLTVVIIAAVAAPLLAPYNPTATDLHHVLSGPSALHPLGTDSLGRDVLSRLMYGGRVSLTGVVEALVVFLVLGVSAGATAGFLGGWVDGITSRAIEVLLAVPVIIALLVVLSVVGSNETAAMITVGALSAPALAWVVRGAVRAVKEELYIAASKVAGLPTWRIVLGQVLPRVSGPVIVQASLGAGGALLAQAGIEFLGLGVQPPTPTWGGLVADASNVVQQQPWLLVPSGGVIGLTILAFGLLGDAVRDASARDATQSPPTRSRLRAKASQARKAPEKVAVPAEPDEQDPTGLLVVRNVSVVLPTSTGPATVVSGVSLTIGEGEIVGLMGESGCGKSITGRAVLGLLPAGGWISAGSVHFAGRELVGLPQPGWRGVRGAQIALVSQEPIGSLDPMFTVGHQVGELVRRHQRHNSGSRQAVRARTLELLASVRLPDPARVARRYPHELSGGMAQRVAIAMALAGDPKLLIADEPTTALDVTVQSEILDLLRDLQQEKKMSILLISHDWGVIANLCQRAYVMYAGQVVESASFADLIDHPRHPYTAGLLGCSPRRAQPRTPLRAIAGIVPDARHWPTGCHFRPRCPLAAEECAVAPIPLSQPEPAHCTRCLRHDRVDDLMEEGDHG